MDFDLDELAEDYGLEYMREKSDEEELFDMEMLDDMMDSQTPTEIIMKAFFGDDYEFLNSNDRESFNPNREYFYFNVYGNLVSVDARDKVEFIKEHLDEDDFIEWCKDQGYVDEDEDEDDYEDDEDF